MKTITHTTDIAASPEVVWATLTDFESYQEWNPFMTIEGTPAQPGDRLEVTIRPGKRTMTFTPSVTALVPGVSIAWLGRMILPRVFDGAHELRIEPLDNGETRFTQHETFRGILVPFVGSILRDTSAGFAAMNNALRDRAELIDQLRSSLTERR